MSQSGSLSTGGSGGGGITTIVGDVGSISGATVTIYANNAGNGSGSSVLFSNSTNVSTLTVTDGNNNTLIGQNAGNSSASTNLTQCTSVGQDTLSAAGLSTQYCTAMGFASSFSLNTGSDITSYGAYSLEEATTGQGNCAFGAFTLEFLQTGNYNCAFGDQAGRGYSADESSNILINHQGATSDSNTLRIGSGTGTETQQLNQSFISGIYSNNQPQSTSVQVVTIQNGLGGSPDLLGVTSISAFAWIDLGDPVVVAAQTGYFITDGLTAQLPSSPNQGDTISFAVDTTNPFIIQATGTQMIRIGTNISSAAGTATNTFQGDSITLVYRLADTTWFSVTGPQGNWVLS